MKLSVRLTTLVISAAAFAGYLGAQSRSSGHSAPRTQARTQARAQVRAQSRPQARQQFASRAQPERFSRENVRVQRYAPQHTETLARAGVQVRNDFRGSAGVEARAGFRDRADYRPVPVAAHGRPLITRGGVVTPRGFERTAAFRGAHFGAGFNRWGGRLVLPVGWGSRVIFGGFFPVAYAGYCEAVPYDYDYLLPPMAPSYDPCLFGDRVIVYDRFSRSIVFAASL